MSVQLIPPKQKIKRRKFNPQQKLQILKEWERGENGIEIAEKHQIHPQTLYRWKKALERGAQTFLSGKKQKVDVRIKDLEKENQRLKETLVEQTKELMRVKKEMNLV